MTKASQKDTVKATVLVVEDSATQREALEHILSANGYNVVEASNGAEALEMTAAHQPDIVLTDIVMPEMDGYELCRSLKADGGRTRVPVLLVTSLSDPQDVLKGLECGADNFIVKPYREEELLVRIQYILLNRHMQSEDRAEMGVEIVFAGQRHFITSGRLQILNLLLSTYDTAVRKNVELERIQEEMRQLNDTLEQKVMERTAQLRTEMEERERAQEALERSLQRLERAKNLEAIGMIAGGVAHEVRNPLFAISTIVTALERKLSHQPEFAEYTAHIAEQTRRLNELMNDLLTLGRPILLEEFRPCPMREVVSQALTRLDGVHPGACIRCTVQAPAEPLAVSGVRDKLEQVIFNLLHNAFQFSPEEERLEVRIWRAGPLVGFSVTDHGPGVPAEMLPILFQPFASKRKGGTGLGLAIVQKIVNAHGGTVEAANNDPPPGATFTVRLPLAEASKAAARR